MIRLLSVIGHGKELIPHFINHYKDLVDEINLIVYSSKINPSLKKEVSDIIKGYNNVYIVHEEYNRLFDWERVTELYNKIKSRYKNDWWVIADIDEFHLYPTFNLKDITNYCDENSWEIVRGGFIDRIGENGEFSKLTSENIFQQFPNAGFFRYPLSSACPNKICLLKGHIELTPGQHYVKIEGQTTWRWQGWNHPLIAPIEKLSVQVHHFKWDETSIERIKQVSDVKEEFSYWKEYKKMYDELHQTNFKIDLSKEEFMFERCSNEDFKLYKNWNKLIRKIISI